MKLIEFRDSFTAVISEDQWTDAVKRRKSSKSPTVLKVTMEATHSFVNTNSVLYPPDKLAGQKDFVFNGRKMPTGVYSLLEPYPKPILVDHQSQSSGAAIGRVLTAKFSETTQAGVPGIIVTARIADPEAVERILDGRFYTVSVGLQSDAAICSICGVNQVDGFCDHVRGREYDGERAYWIAGNLWFQEISYVNVPADQWAKNIHVQEVQTLQDSAESSLERPRIITLVASSAGKEEQVLDQDKKPEALLEDEQQGTTSEDLEAKLEAMEARLQQLEEQNSALREQLDAHIAAQEESRGQDSTMEDSNGEGSEPAGQDTEGGRAEETEPAAQSRDSGEAPLADEKMTDMVDMLAERVVDLRIALGKSPADQREELLDRYSRKSIDYLSDALVDLVDEIKRLPADRPSYSKASVQSPGLAAGSEANVEIVDGEGDEGHTGEKTTVSRQLIEALYEKRR